MHVSLFSLICMAHWILGLQSTAWSPRSVPNSRCHIDRYGFGQGISPLGVLFFFFIHKTGMIAVFFKSQKELKGKRPQVFSQILFCSAFPALHLLTALYPLHHNSRVAPLGKPSVPSNVGKFLMWISLTLCIYPQSYLSSLISLMVMTFEWIFLLRLCMSQVSQLENQRIKKEVYFRTGSHHGGFGKFKLSQVGWQAGYPGKSGRN